MPQFDKVTLLSFYADAVISIVKWPGNDATRLALLSIGLWNRFALYSILRH